MLYTRPLWQILEPGPRDEFPNKIYIIIEVSKGSKEKYELNKETGALFLDRDLSGSMVYPGDYGSVPKTLCKDGDPVDALIMTTRAHHPGVIITAKPVAILKMEDESGRDDKILCVPDYGIEPPAFKQIKGLDKVPKYILAEVKDFFEHYKRLEPDKWVKIEGWKDEKLAKKHIVEAVKLYKEKYKDD